jgi:hypothetical protein
MSAGLLDLKINMVAVAVLTYRLLYFAPRGLKDFDIRGRMSVTA